MANLTPSNRNHFPAGRGFGSPWDDLDSMFEKFFSRSFLPSFFDQKDTMKVDIKETDKAYIVEAEIPGVKKDNIKLELSDDMLTIHVQRDEQVEEERVNYIRKERKTFSTSRSFYVENVKHEDVTAKYENGILKVILPKREKGVKKGKYIDIN